MSTQSESERILEYVRRVAATAGPSSGKLRLWLRRVERDGDGCWLWTGLTTVSASGRHHPILGAGFGADRHHTAFWFFMRHWFPRTEHVNTKPRCGKDRCVNPLCRTALNGADNGLNHIKLSPKQVVAIRNDTDTPARELAALYGVHRITIQRIRKGRTFAWLLDHG